MYMTILKNNFVFTYILLRFKMIFDIIHPSSFNFIINSKCKEASKMSNNIIIQS